MPYKLRKAPKRELYWVVTIETGKKHSKEPIPLEKAQAQMRILKQSLHGGMMKVGNPLVAATPEQDAKKIIQRILDSANSARAMSIAIKEGHKSMDAIMNEAALELFKAGKAGAVQYLNELREPYESREEYKAEDSTARNKLAREMGLEVKGMGRHGGMMAREWAGRFGEQSAERAARVEEQSAELYRIGREAIVRARPPPVRQVVNPIRRAVARLPNVPTAREPSGSHFTLPDVPTVDPGTTGALCGMFGDCMGELFGGATGKKRGRAKACGPPYHDYSKGKASAFVLTCIDPRYTFDVAYYLQHKKELHQDYDLFTLAGASVGATKKEWKKTFYDTLDLGLKLHGIKEVWCFDHLDCGMYKATFGLKKDLDPKIHMDCMEKLKKVIKKKYPQLKFRKFLVDAKGHIKSMDKVGGNMTESIKTGLRRAIRYIYSQGNNLAYYSAIFAGAIAAEQFTNSSGIYQLLSRIFPDWFVRFISFISTIGHGANIKVVLDFLLEPLNIDGANPEDADPAAIEQPPEPSWLQSLLARREDNPGHLHQD